MKFKEFGKYAYPVFRILIGVLFFTHGAQKLFGWFGGSSFDLFSLMGFVGLMEILGGIAIALGIFTRLAALLSIILMISIYIKAHIPRAILPMNNGGELATLYLLAFLIILWLGGRKWSLGKKLFKKV
jgi:putative oxidoreductase